jgi:type VI secretion system VasD/TssJ family lipoprotein
MSVSHHRIAAAVCLALALAGCGQGALSIRAVAPVNLNVEGESLPVKVRIYALRDDGRFRSALFSDLWTRDREVLGDDRLQDAKVVIVAPRGPAGKADEIDLGELPKETRFIGIMALYRRPDEPDRRRIVLPVDLIGDRVVELVDSSVVVYAKGDPSPVRPITDPAKKDDSAAPSSTAATPPKSDSAKMP